MDCSDGIMFSLYGDECILDFVARRRFDGLAVTEALPAACLLPEGELFIAASDTADDAAAVSATSLFASAIARDTLGGASGFHPSFAPNTPHGDAFGLNLCPFGFDFFPEPVSRRNIGRDLVSGVFVESIRFLRQLRWERL